MKKTLTIIIQGYNPSIVDIKNTISSLDKQKDKDFEVIFFDNGSDKSGEPMLKDVPFNNYKFVRNSLNKGVADGRNKAVSFVKEGFIARVDDGDTISKNFTEEINTKIRDGNDLILIPNNYKKKVLFPTSPFKYILDKEDIINFPLQPKYFLEDIFSLIYYFSNSRKPALINVSYTAAINSRGGNNERLLAFATNWDDPSGKYWIMKINRNSLTAIDCRIDRLKIKKGSKVGDIISKVEYCHKIWYLKLFYENMPKENLKFLKKAYKTYHKFTLNPYLSLGPQKIYRFFKKG